MIQLVQNTIYAYLRAFICISIFKVKIHVDEVRSVWAAEQRSTGASTNISDMGLEDDFLYRPLTLACTPRLT